MNILSQEVGSVALSNSYCLTLKKSIVIKQKNSTAKSRIFMLQLRAKKIRENCHIYKNIYEIVHIQCVPKITPSNVSGSWQYLCFHFHF